MMRHMRHLKNKQKQSIPWMVAPSFETDGRQLKLQLKTSTAEHPGAPGLMHLHKEGYRVSFRDQTFEDAMEIGNGVYRLQHIRAVTEASLSGLTVTPIDPGQIQIVEGAHYPAENCTSAQALDLLNGDHHRVSMSGKEYNIKTLRKRNETAEEHRRHNTPYGQAMDALRTTRRRTAELPAFLNYCRVFQAVQSWIWVEVLSFERRIHRFARFRAIQRTIEEIAERIAPVKGVSSEDRKQRVVMFEDGIWRPRAGATAAPMKKIVRAVCQRAVVIMVPAAYSSQTCPCCGSQNFCNEQREHRTRICTRNPECALHSTANNMVATDRDKLAKTVIAIRAVDYIVGRLAGLTTQYLRPRNP